MIPALGAGGLGFDSRSGPIVNPFGVRSGPIVNPFGVRNRNNSLDSAAFESSVSIFCVLRR
jgi:hypothetical protein